MRIDDLQKSLRILQFPQGIFSDEDLSGSSNSFQIEKPFSIRCFGKFSKAIILHISIRRRGKKPGVSEAETKAAGRLFSRKNGRDWFSDFDFRSFPPIFPADFIFSKNLLSSSPFFTPSDGNGKINKLGRNLLETKRERERLEIDKISLLTSKERGLSRIYDSPSEQQQALRARKRQIQTRLDS